MTYSLVPVPGRPRWTCSCGARIWTPGQTLPRGWGSPTSVLCPDCRSVPRKEPAESELDRRIAEMAGPVKTRWRRPRPAPVQSELSPPQPRPRRDARLELCERVQHLLRADPLRTNVSVAAETGAGRSTVSRLRTALERAGEIPGTKATGRGAVRVPDSGSPNLAAKDPRDGTKQLPNP
jgi:hypothetical protein